MGSTTAAAAVGGTPGGNMRVARHPFPLKPRTSLSSMMSILPSITTPPPPPPTSGSFRNHSSSNQITGGNTSSITGNGHYSSSSLQQHQKRNGTMVSSALPPSRHYSALSARRKMSNSHINQHGNGTGIGSTSTSTTNSSMHIQSSSSSQSSTSTSSLPSLSSSSLSSTLQHMPPTSKKIILPSLQSTSSSKLIPQHTGHSSCSNSSTSGNAASNVASTCTTSKSWLAAAAAPPRTAAIATGHVLHRTFQFSYVVRGRAKDYVHQLRNIAKVGTVEEFWQVYVHLHRVSKLSPSTDYFLFQDGIRPLWEDEGNRRGGRFALRITKSASPQAFEDLCLALVGEQFDTDDICGIGCSVRVTDNFLSIWLKDASDKDLLVKVEGIARKTLDLPGHTVVKDWCFKPHQIDQQNGT